MYRRNTLYYICKILSIWFWLQKLIFSKLKKRNTIKNVLSVCFPKNQFYLHKLHIHTHTLKHPWHFLPFQIIILTKGKLFFFCVWLCDFDFWSYFALDGDLLTLHWKHENSFYFDSLYVIRNPFLMTAASFPGSLSPSPFAPYLGKLITNICVLHHLTDGHFKQYKYQPRRVPWLQIQPHQQ